MSQAASVLRIPADLTRLAEIRAFVRDWASHLGADPATTHDIVLAVDELATNSIVHGYRGSEGVVEVEVSSRNGSLVVRLRDHAPEFDPTSVPDPDIGLPLERRPLGGLGIYLSRDVSDRLSYRRTGQFNELTIVKRLAKAEGGTRC